MAGPTTSERLQKVAARAGLGSRRALERLIREGRVKLNGEPAELGATVQPGDRVDVEGRSHKVRAVKSDKVRVLIYNKPEGEVTTRSDPEGRPTVFDRLPGVRQGRWIAIGRLDLNTSGLLLLTTDGELANAMMHPSGGVDREYACRIHGRVTDEMIDRLKTGVELEDGTGRFTDVVVGDGGATNRWYYVAMMEGRNREVRRLWESQGVQVSRLKRVRYGAVPLPDDLRPGKWVELQPDDIRTLREDVGLDPQADTLTLDPVKPSKAKTSGKKQRDQKKPRAKGPKRKGSIKRTYAETQRRGDK